jgi:hypothetical protein
MLARRRCSDVTMIKETGGENSIVIGFGKHLRALLYLPLDTQTILVILSDRHDERAL